MELIRYFCDFFTGIDELMMVRMPAIDVPMGGFSSQNRMDSTAFRFENISVGPVSPQRSVSLAQTKQVTSKIIAEPMSKGECEHGHMPSPAPRNLVGLDDLKPPARRNLVSADRTRPNLPTEAQTVEVCNSL